MIFGSVSGRLLEVSWRPVKALNGSFCDGRHVGAVAAPYE
jgi:hypothetical protein